MIGVLLSFDDTYITNTPITDSIETRFVLSIIGLVVNLSTTDTGREFFSKNDNGKNVMQLILHIVHRIPSPSGNQLKK